MTSEVVKEVLETKEECKPLVLNHMFLYAKGWYKHSKNIWQDYRRAIICDGHYTPYSRHDVAHIMFKYLTTYADKLMFWSEKDNISLYLYEEIRNKIDFLKYYYKSRNIEVTPVVLYDEAVIMICHSRFMMADKKVFDKILCPSSKVLPLNKSYTECRADVKDMFGKIYKPYDTKDSYAKNFFKSLSTYNSLKKEIKEGNLIYEEK